MNMNFMTERFEEGDLEELHSLVVRTIKRCYFEYYPREAVDYFIEYSNREAILKDGREHFVIVLKDGDRIVGTGTLAGAHVRRVFVDPDYQGEGLGRKIMALLEEKAREDGFDIVELHSSLFAKHFYDTLGYRMFRLGKIGVASNELLYYQRMGKPLAGESTSLKWDLDGKTFRISGTDDATGFWFCQRGGMVYAEYGGGRISSGELFGMMEDDTVVFHYEHEGPGPEIHSGRSKMRILMHGNNGIRLIGEQGFCAEKKGGGFILDEI